MSFAKPRFLDWWWGVIFPAAAIVGFLVSVVLLIQAPSMGEAVADNYKAEDGQIAHMRDCGDYWLLRKPDGAVYRLERRHFWAPIYEIQLFGPTK